MQTLVAFAKLVLGGILAWWLGLRTVFQLLLVLMAIDIATGLIVAYIAKSLSSEVSFRGIAKKVLIVLLVVAAEAVTRLYLGPLNLDAHLGELVAGFYCAHEGLSILENVVAVGLPVPRQLRDALAKLAPEKIDNGDAVG